MFSVLCFLEILMLCKFLSLCLLVMLSCFPFWVFVSAVCCMSTSLMCSDSSVFTLVSVLVRVPVGLVCMSLCMCVCLYVCAHVCTWMYMHVYICKALRANPRLGALSSLRYYYYYMAYVLLITFSVHTKINRAYMLIHHHRAGNLCMTIFRVHSCMSVA